MSLPAAALKKARRKETFPMVKCIAALLMAAQLASCVAASVAGAAVKATDFKFAPIRWRALSEFKVQSCFRNF